ncbi:MAG: glycosyltransferase family 39 protein [Candidatus Krumholzibacteriota bacterium]
MIRLLLDFFIYLARHMIVAFALTFTLWVLLVRYKQIQNAFGTISPTTRRRGVVGLCMGVILVFAGIGAWYLVQDGFAGEVEPVISSLSWLVQSGEPLYHDVESAQRYSVLYGPSVFLTNGLFLKVLGPSLFSAKLASILGVLGCLVFLYAALARSGRDWVALAVTSLAALYFWSQGFAVYLVRPDALLVFAIGLTLFSVAKGRKAIALVTLAVMFGFAVNLKVHAALYFLPILPLAARRFGWRSLFPTMLGAGGVIAAPFVFHPQVSIVNYVAWLRNAVGHGLVADSVAVTLQYTAYLLLPVAVLLLVSPVRASQLKQHAAVLLGLVASLALTLVLAAKPGAGLVHLLPLVPSTMYIAGMLLQEILEVRNWSPISPVPGLRQCAVAAVVMTALLTGSVNAYRAVRLVDWQISQAPDLASDVQGIIEQFPDLSIGMACGGENASFRHTWLRPLLVFADNPLLVEPVSVMDCRLTGLKMPPETYRALEKGIVNLWLVPRGQRPFDKENWYAPHDPVFSNRFRQHFESLYSRAGHSRYFDLWVWDGLDVRAPQGPMVTEAGLGRMGFMVP